MAEIRNVVTYGKSGKRYRVRCWQDRGDWGLGYTLEETTSPTLYQAVQAARRMSDQYDAEWSEDEMKAHFGVKK